MVTRPGNFNAVTHEITEVEHESQTQHLEPSLLLESLPTSKIAAPSAPAPNFKSIQEGCADFDVPAFLTGKYADPKAQAKNHQVLDQSVASLKTLAHSYIQRGLSKPDAYKQVLRDIDSHDDEQFQSYRAAPTKTGLSAPKSTYAVRTALLKASLDESGGLESYQVYMRNSEQLLADPSKKWEAIENPRNWVFEAQGKHANYLLFSYVKARELAKGVRSSDRRSLVLLKGGFGAGKTAHAKTEYGSMVNGVVAPDGAKRDAGRKSDETITHAAVHVEGSQMAYEVFDELIKSDLKQVAYDSSLSRPSDLKAYLEKAEKGQRVALVRDISRPDTLRMLTVLKRNVNGEDPRIPVRDVIAGAVRDKAGRAEVMNTLMKRQTDSKHEYHLVCGGDDGSPFREVVQFLSDGTPPRISDPRLLESQGVRWDEASRQFKALQTEGELKMTLETQMRRSVRETLADYTGLSTRSSQDYETTFTKRILLDTPLTGADPHAWYTALSPRMRQAISESDFVAVMNTIDFATLSGKQPITFMDLPLGAALDFNSRLRSNPWA